VELIFNASLSIRAAKKGTYGVGSFCMNLYFRIIGLKNYRTRQSLVLKY
jgi:hypothetical protein